MVEDKSIGSKVFNVINGIIMAVIIAVTVYPLLYVLALSLSSAEYVQAGLVNLIPKGFNLQAYKQVLGDEYFWKSYGNTVLYTVVGTTINLVLTSTFAFCLSRKNLIFRKQLTVLIIFTMFFSGGIIPNFILVKNLGIYNTMWAVVLPGAINTYNMIIVRTFMQQLPEEIFESGRIDGANDLQLFAKIVVPLSKPALATIGLYYAVDHWNAYFYPMLYLKDKVNYPLQVLLKEMLVEQDFSNMSQSAAEIMGNIQPTTDMLMGASIVIALIPILCVYPFIQRYFVQGVMIGSLKG
ncbi:carbohydrate ABC transporter permease [Blautia sp.]|uniref:carbohydrate ABC transporter permease n=1 Tax=Blautia sp. TaxID=1955243 RepID=UPI002E765FF9|nr:carbohydrate ABC transporter permease [Blautia sp.]MEE0809627.1 carbohydrate ABC transporter permease [Blautia sp.]